MKEYWNKGNNSFTIGFIIVALVIVGIFYNFYSKDKPILNRCLQEYRKDYEVGLERWELFEKFKECYPF